MLKAEFSLTPTNDTSVHPVIMSDVNKIDGNILLRRTDNQIHKRRIFRGRQILCIVPSTYKREASRRYRKQGISLEL